MDARWDHRAAPPPQPRAPASFLAPAAPSPPPPRPAAGGGAEPPPHIVHALLPSDTLQGLAFRYHVTPAEIRLLNDLPSDNLATCGRELRIPVGARAPLPTTRDAPDPRAATLRAFRVSHRLSEPEARYYLEDAGWDSGLAAAALAQDLAFETRNPGAVGALVAGATVKPSGGAGRPAPAPAPASSSSSPAGLVRSLLRAVGAAGGGSGGGGGGAAGPAPAPAAERPRSEEQGELSALIDRSTERPVPGVVLRQRKKAE
jgi:hypothetical protein